MPSTRPLGSRALIILAVVAAAILSMASAVDADTRAGRAKQDAQAACARYATAFAWPTAAGTSKALHKAALLGKRAASRKHRWEHLERSLRTQASMPNAMLTSTQRKRASAASRAIRRACESAGAPLTSDPTSQRARAAATGWLNDNTRTAFNYLIQKTGLTPIQVAGIVGNLDEESNGMTPALGQYGCGGQVNRSCSYGIAQWTIGRYKQLVAAYPNTYATLNGELSFVVDELNGGERQALADLKHCNELTCATRVIEQEYERNLDKDCLSSNCSYGARLQGAQRALNAYLGGTAALSATVAMAVANSGGYYLLSPDGTVHAYGGAPFDGQPAGQDYFTGQTAVAIATAPGGGYYVLSAAGGVYSYGAPSYGSAAGQPYFAGQTATALAAAPDGSGYWILSAAGGVYSYGAPFHGSAAGQPYFADQTATALAAAPDGSGYWILSAAGGVYSYGAPFHGSAAGQPYFAGQTATALAAAPDGSGYWILSAAGGVYSYGAPFHGSAAGQPYFARLGAVAVAPTRDSNGYWIVSNEGGVYSYGDAPYEGGAN